MKKISLLLALTLILGIVVPFISIGQRIPNKHYMFSKSNRVAKHTTAFQSQNRGKMNPHQAMVYAWNVSGSSWDINCAEKYVYYSDGHNMFTYSLSPDLSDTFTIETTLYDPYGNLTYRTTEIND